MIPVISALILFLWGGCLVGRAEVTTGPARGRAGAPGWSAFAVASGGILLLVALPPAEIWGRWGWGVVVLVACAWGLALANAWQGRRLAPALTNATGVRLLLAVGLAGFLLTGLFWVRAALGIPAGWLGDLGLKMGTLFGGWPWPALLLAGLVGLMLRPRGSGGPALLGVALVAGTLGWGAHFPVADAVRSSSSAGTGEVRRALEEPLATRPGLAALSVLGQPRSLEVRPNGLYLSPDETRTLELHGRTFPGTRSNLSRPGRGSRVRVTDASVVEVVRAPEGDRWALRSRAPGASAVEIRAGAATQWIGVRVSDEDEADSTPVDVTDQVTFEVGDTREPGPSGGFALRQTVRMTNHSDMALVGPLHLVIGFSAEAEPVLVGAGRVRHPEVRSVFGSDWRVSVAEIFPGPDGLRPIVPALAPGASSELELRVVAPLDPDAPDVELRVFESIRTP